MTRCCAPPGLSGLSSAVGTNSYGGRIANVLLSRGVVPDGLDRAAESKRGRSRTCECTRLNAPSFLSLFSRCRVRETVLLLAEDLLLRSKAGCAPYVL